MKKALTVAFVAVLAVSAVFAPGAIAQGNQSSSAGRQQGVRDANGDGICDVTGLPMGTGSANGQASKNGRTMGPGNGSGNSGSGPKDGTGYGAQSGKRLGPQDGSGAGQHRPSGRGGRRG